MSIRLDTQHQQVFEKAISAMAEFKRVFGRDLKPEFVAELYAAFQFGLEVFSSPNHQGFDAVGSDGKRYEVKLRNAQNVDLRNFDFDYLVLVNLDEAYQLTGMWRLTQEQAKVIFRRREKYDKYQTTQDSFKAHAERVR